MTLSSSARNPGVKPRETWASLSSTFRMEPAPEKKPTQRCGQFFTRKRWQRAKHSYNRCQIRPPRDVGAVSQSTHQSVQHRSDKRYTIRTISGFRTSRHVTTDPSSNQPIKMYRNASTGTPYVRHHQQLQDLTPRDDEAIFQ